MNLLDLENKLVAVLGFGQEGRATAEYLTKHGIKPVLFDQRPWQEWEKSEQEYVKSLGLNFIFGPGCFKELTGFDVAFRSPGVPLLHLKSYTLNLTSQTKWFFENCPAKIIGVTGTKGKGTTSTLIYEMLMQQAKTSNPKAKIFLTGNIGKIQPLDFLDSLDADDWVVYELSSFQLQDLSKSPHIGVVLMVTAEHLDYHKNIKEYQQAKTAIVKYQSKQDFAIINQDFPASVAIGAFGKGKKIFFSRQKSLSQGCFVKDDQIIAKGVSKTDLKFKIADLQLKGTHNLENVCASVLATLTAGCAIQSIKNVLKDFKGLEHRLEFVAEKQGIKFYNDSFSTTPETAIAAIKAFTEPEIVILGGSSKNSNFKELGKTIYSANNIKALILIGTEAGKIKDAIKGKGGFKGKILGGAKNMENIFKQIKLTATTGDIVLLSPACASFDMFKNYKERGERFKNAVMKF